MATIWFHVVWLAAVVGPDLGVLVGATRDSHLLAPILLLEHPFCGSRAGCYFLPNLIVEVVNLLLIGSLAYAFSAQRIIPAVCAVILAIIAPFAAVYLYIPSGAESGLSLTLFLVLLWMVWRSNNDQGKRVYLAAVSGLAVLVLQSPPYAGSAAFLILWGRCQTWGRNSSVPWLPLLLPILAVASRAFATKFGTAAIMPPLDDPTLVVSLLVIALSAFAVWPLLLRIRVPAATDRKLADPVYLWLTLPIGLLVSVAWSNEVMFSDVLYPAYLALLLAASLAAGRNRSINKPVLLAVSCIAIAVGLLGVTPALRRGGLLRSQATLGNTIQHGLTGARGFTDQVFVADHGDPLVSRWTFAGSDFFRVYYGRDAHVSYVTELVDVPRQPGPEPPVLVDASDNPAMLSHASYALLRALHRPRRRGFDFVRSFALGRINDSRPISGTPTHRGVFIQIVSGPVGALPIMEVLGGYTYTFGNVAISRGSKLRFWAAKPLSVGPPIQGTIFVNDDGRRTMVWRGLFPAAGQDGPQWRGFVIPLDRFAGTHVSVTYEATVPSRNGLGAWLSFALPVLTTARQ